jgi:hypothetical protein
MFAQAQPQLQPAAFTQTGFGTQAFNFGSPFGGPRDFVIVDTGSEELTAQIMAFAHQESATHFEVTVVLPCSAVSAMIAGLFKRSCDRAVFPSVTVGVCSSANNSMGDESAPVFQFREGTPVRTLDFRGCRFEQCDLSLRNGPQIAAPSAPQPFSFGNANASPFANAPLLNTVTLKFVAATLVLSEAQTKREARWMPNLARSPARHDLPYFPGVSLVRSFDRNLSFAVPWNMFAMSFNKRTYWLYPRRTRLLFRTLLMIRKYRDHAGLGRLDMNVVRIIFDLIATPRPLWLPLAEQEVVLGDTQERYRMMLADESSSAEVRFTFGSSSVKTVPESGTVGSLFVTQNAGGGFAKWPSAATAAAVQAQPTAGGFNFGGAANHAGPGLAFNRTTEEPEWTAAEKEALREAMEKPIPSDDDDM